MRGSIARLGSITALVLAVGLLLRVPAHAACCIEGCGSDTISWTSCTNTSECTGGFCPSPIGSAIQFDPTATCGEGGLPFSTCPPNEVGQCADGVNNDEWTGDLATDCLDPDCALDPACPQHSVPVAGGIGLAATAIGLLVLGVFAVRSRLRGKTL